MYQIEFKPKEVEEWVLQERWSECYIITQFSLR